jgi:hypothetical protein
MTRTDQETTEPDAVNSDSRDFNLDRDHTDPDLTRSGGVGADDTSRIIGANPTTPHADDRGTDRAAHPAPLPAMRPEQQEQQEQAQAIVDAFADRLRHAPDATGLMELAADALAEIAETFGGEVDVEHLRAALVRHWP